VFDAFIAWLKLTIPDTDYVYSRGMWIENKDLNASKIISIRQDGGPPTDVDDRRARYKVIMLGARDKREDAPTVSADINTLVLAALDGSKPCESAGIRAMSEPTGPGFTTEGRAWYSLDFEVTF
jgi:hypothetical protein